MTVQFPKRSGSGYPTLPPGLKNEPSRFGDRPGSVTLQTEEVTGVCRNGINCGSYRYGREDAYQHTKTVTTRGL